MRIYDILNSQYLSINLENRGYFAISDNFFRGRNVGNVLLLFFAVFLAVFLSNTISCKNGSQGRMIPKTGWSASSNYRGDIVKNAFDNRIKTRWDTGAIQSPGMYFELNLGEPYRISQIVLDLDSSIKDYPRKLEIKVSLDMRNWNTLMEGVSSKPVEGRVYHNTGGQSMRLPFWNSCPPDHKGKKDI
jgi:hypothetical protein